MSIEPLIDPLKFKGEFSFHYIEDENGRAPPSYKELVCYIPLETSIDPDTSNIRFHGKQSQFKPACMNVKLNHHNFGILFSVECQNTEMKNKVIWRRAVTRDWLHKHFNTKPIAPITLDGDAPEVPNALPSTATLTMEKDKIDWKATTFELHMSFDAYKQFISRYQYH